MNVELRRHRRLVRARVPLGREAPAEDGLCEDAEVLEAVFPEAPLAMPMLVRMRRLCWRPFALVHPGIQQLLSFDVVTVEDGAGLDQRGSGDDQAVRLDEAEPFEVNAGVWIGRGQGVIP